MIESRDKNKTNYHRNCKQDIVIDLLSGKKGNYVLVYGDSFPRSWRIFSIWFCLRFSKRTKYVSQSVPQFPLLRSNPKLAKALLTCQQINHLKNNIKKRSIFPKKKTFTYFKARQMTQLSNALKRPLIHFPSEAFKDDQSNETHIPQFGLPITKPKCIIVTHCSAATYANPQRHLARPWPLGDLLWKVIQKLHG